MKTRTTYIAFDGKEFTNLTEAKQHEAKQHALSITRCMFCGQSPEYGYKDTRDAVVIRCSKCSIELACRVDGGLQGIAATEARERWSLLMRDHDAC